MDKLKIYAKYTVYTLSVITLGFLFWYVLAYVITMLKVCDIMANLLSFL